MKEIGLFGTSGRDSADARHRKSRVASVRIPEEGDKLVEEPMAQVAVEHPRSPALPSSTPFRIRHKIRSIAKKDRSANCHRMIWMLKVSVTNVVSSDKNSCRDSLS